MSDAVLIAVAAVVGLQFPAALLVRLDAGRLDLERPNRYPAAVATILLFGWVVLASYLARRDELPRADETSGVDPPAGGHRTDGPRLVWAVDPEGPAWPLRRLRRWVAGVARPVWWGWFVAVPAVLLAATLLVDRRIAAAYLWYAVLSSLSVWGLSGWCSDVVVTVDTDAATLTVLPVGGDPDDGREYGLAALESARFVDVGAGTTVDCRYDPWFLLRPGTVVVPAEAADDLAAALRACDVAVSERSATNPVVGGPELATLRSAVLLAVLGVGPVVLLVA